MRAIAYFRTADPAQLAEMEQTFVEYCRFNMHQPVTTFADVGATDGPPYPEHQRMVQHMQGSEFLVVVPSASHLGTDLESVTRAVVALDALRAKVVCYDEEFPDPLQNAFHTLGVKGVSRTRSHSIKESMRARALQGKALGRPLYGYRIGPEGVLEVVKEQAAVVELIFRLYTRDRLGFRLIAQHLNERAILTRRGGRWNVASIRDILRNPAYTGTYTRLDMRRPKAHAAIIPADIFRAAQAQVKARRPVGRVAHHEPFLLSGLAYCSYCGNKMMGVTRRQSWRRKDGHRARQVYRYYQCQSRNNQSMCGYHTWRAPLLESVALGQLKYALSAPPVRGEPVEAQPPRAESAQAEREAGVRNAERRFLRAMRRAARGDITVGGLGRYLDGLDAARRAAGSPRGSQNIQETLDGWDSLDLEARRAFLTEHLARIVVEDDTVQVLV